MSKGKRLIHNTTNCKMWMSMMDMEHEVVWYVHCKGDEFCERREKLLRMEVGELRKEIGELKKEVGELRV